MPSIYAHYRFGAELLTQLPPELQRSAKRFRQLYDMGLHGPDLFYYEHAIPKLYTGKLGLKHHSPTGKAYFHRACRMLRLHPSEGAMAYLLGVLAHYALDSLSHPYILRMAEEKGVPRSVIETEFDRFLLEKDGRTPAYLQDLSEHIHLTPGECQTAALFYPGVSDGVVSRCVKNMSKFVQSLLIPNGGRRRAMEKFLKLAGPETAGMLMTVHPNRACSRLDPSLLRLYELAMDRYWVLLDQVQEHLRKNAPLGTDFAAVFG